MTNQEAVKNLLNLKKSLDSYCGLNETGKETFRRAIAALDYTESMKGVHNCNDCGVKDCEIEPRVGETVRYNCYRWRAKDECTG